MSQRHRSHEVVQPPKMDLRAKAHNERHRIRVELQAVAEQIDSGLDPEDVHEPGRAWVPETRHDSEREFGSSRTKRHWKLKMWKRRSSLRRARAQLTELAAREA